MPFVKGQSGNLAGRPRKKRPLAETFLEQAYRPNSDFPSYSNQQVLSLYLWSGLTTGFIHLGAQSYKLTYHDWLELVKWASQHIDGPHIHTASPDMNTPVAEFVPAYAEAREISLPPAIQPALESGMESVPEPMLASGIAHH